LVDLFESYDDARTYERQVLVDLQGVSVHKNGQTEAN